MKHFKMAVVFSLVLASMLIAYGDNAARKAEDQASSSSVSDNFVPLTMMNRYGDAYCAQANGESVVVDDPGPLPLSVGEAPISLLTSPQYPDPLRPSIALYDLTEDVCYNLEDVFPNDFTVYSEHDYRLNLQLRSDGGDIKDIKVEIELPENGRCIRLLASNSETKQILMLARIFLIADDQPPIIQPTDEADPLLDPGIFVGDINNTPTEIDFNFHIE